MGYRVNRWAIFGERTLMSDIWIPCALIIIRQILKFLKISKSLNSVSKFKKKIKILIENKKVIIIINNVYL